MPNKCFNFIRFVAANQISLANPKKQSVKSPVIKMCYELSPISRIFYFFYGNICLRTLVIGAFDENLLFVLYFSSVRHFIFRLLSKAQCLKLILLGYNRCCLCAKKKCVSSNFWLKKLLMNAQGCSLKGPNHNMVCTTKWTSCQKLFVL